MPSFSYDFPYASKKLPIFAANVVASSQHLAATAGLRMLARGGNAVDVFDLGFGLNVKGGDAGVDGHADLVVGLTDAGVDYLFRVAAAQRAGSTER